MSAGGFRPKRYRFFGAADFDETDRRAANRWPGAMGYRAGEGNHDSYDFVGAPPSVICTPERQTGARRQMIVKSEPRRPAVRNNNIYLMILLFKYIG